MFFFFNPRRFQRCLALVDREVELRVSTREKNRQQKISHHAIWHWTLAIGHVLTPTTVTLITVLPKNPTESTPRVSSFIRHVLHVCTVTARGQPQLRRDSVHVRYHLSWCLVLGHAFVRVFNLFSVCLLLHVSCAVVLIIVSSSRVPPG